jgi:hypothetical protein
MHIDAVTICVDYADFARHSLPANKQHFDAYTVVSAPDDLETQALCGDLDIPCVLTSALRPYDGIAKARAINLGIGEQYGSDRWIALVDADTVLPAHTRRVLDRIGLEEPCQPRGRLTTVIRWPPVRFAARRGSYGTRKATSCEARHSSGCAMTRRRRSG